jgi:hypothetical protein
MNRPSRTTLLAAAALALVASLVAVGRLASLDGPAASGGRPGVAPSVVKLDVPGPVDDLARTVEPAAGNRVVEHLWILHDGQLLRVDPDAGRVAATVSGYRPRPDRPVVRLTATRAGALLATVAGGGLLVIDPRTARVVATEPVATRARVATTIDADVFAVCGGGTRPGGGRLLRLLGPRPRRMVALPGRPDAVGVGPSGVWVRGAGAGVWRLDTDSLRVVATVAVPGGLGATPGSVAVTAGAVWVSDPARAIVWRLDPERNRLVGSVPADGWDLAVGSDQTVWAASGNRLLGLDRGGLRHTLPLGQLGSDRINAITAGPDALWVAAPTGLFRVDLATLP